VSDLGTVYDFLDSLGPDGTIAYSRGAWLQGAANAGLSFNQAYAQMTGTPIGIRRESALSVWQDIQAVQATDIGVSRIGVTGTAGELLGNEPPPNWTGEYVHTVMTTFRTAQPDGSYTQESRFYGLKGFDLLTPEEAADAAMGIIETAPPSLSDDNYPRPEDVISMQLVGAYYNTNPGALSARNF
jgi:hypothetical protein